MDEKMVCTKCGKSLMCRTTDTGIPVPFTALTIVPNWGDSFNQEDVAAQYGPYPVQSYTLCMECFLRGMGLSA